MPTGTISETAMSETIKQGPSEEQAICVTCGLCCDGTLFRHAILNPGEKGNLPQKIEESVFSEGEKEYFVLPCPYFSGKCSIYDRKRADVCFGYRCQLLKDFNKGKVSLDETLDIIREAMNNRNALIEEYRRVTGRDNAPYFMILLRELGKIQESVTEKEPLGIDYEVLLARCNILEALLIKHFRSVEDFEKMIMK